MVIHILKVWSQQISNKVNSTNEHMKHAFRRMRANSTVFRHGLSTLDDGWEKAHPYPGWKYKLSSSIVVNPGTPQCKQTKTNLESTKHIIPSYVDKHTDMMLHYPSPHFNYKVQCISQAEEHEQKGCYRSSWSNTTKNYYSNWIPQLTNITHQSSILVHNQNCLHHFKKAPFRIMLAVLAFPKNQSSSFFGFR